MSNNDFLSEFKERGFFHQCTNEEDLEKLLELKNFAVYAGFDCTANSLHVGNLSQIMVLKMLQEYGLKPIILLGGGTTKVGDPSGKDETRKLLTEDDVENNKKKIKEIIEKFIKFGDGQNEAILVDNADWLDKLNYIEFLRDYGRHFSINRMLSFDSVKLRLEREQNLSFLEFNYMLLQAYDFTKLYQDYNCRLQVGGSDQWGNIVNGIELNRRLGRKDELFGLTTPLITTSTGAKMGKTAQGAVWLSDELYSSYDFWQYWRNVSDADVVRFLKLFTFLPLSEVNQLAKLEGSDINKAKIILANEVTKLCHGEKAAKDAEISAQKTFKEGKLGDELPVYDIEKNVLEEGIAAFKLLNISGLVDSGGAARRLIKGSGAKINDVVFSDEFQLVTTSDLNDDGVIKLSSGKKKHVIVKIKAS